jgi:hypothetical protein
MTLLIHIYPYYCRHRKTSEKVCQINVICQNISIEDKPTVYPTSEAEVSPQLGPKISPLDEIRISLGIKIEKIPVTDMASTEHGTLQGELPSEDIKVKAALAAAITFLDRPVAIA